MKPQISVVLLRTKTKTHQQKFEAAQRYGPLGFLCLSHPEDRQLAMPKAIEVTIAPCSSAEQHIHFDAAGVAASEEPDHGRGTSDK